MFGNVRKKIARDFHYNFQNILLKGKRETLFSGATRFLFKEKWPSGRISTFPEAFVLYGKFVLSEPKKNGIQKKRGFGRLLKNAIRKKSMQLEENFYADRNLFIYGGKKIIEN
jgi:hypothetical protein